MTVEHMLELLDTLNVVDLRRVVARGQKLLALYASWQPADTAPETYQDGPGAAGEVAGGVSYRQEYVRCGKARCKRCGPDGQGHGPYWYAYWFAGGRTRSKYIGKTLPKTAESTELGQVQPATAPADPMGALTSAPVVPSPALVLPPDEPAHAPAPLTVWLRPSGRKRHLSVDGQTTLCAAPLAGAEQLRAGIFAHDDCQRCRRRAQVLGRVCGGCGLPLLREASPSRCYACVVEGQEQAPGES